MPPDSDSKYAKIAFTAGTLSVYWKSFGTKLLSNGFRDIQW